MLGVTLDSKLTWKPHINRIIRKATTALMQYGQIVGKTWKIKLISGRVDRASATEAVDTGSIPGRVKPKTIKIGIHSFRA